ncbi:hypothetical protein K431DRAFT_345681 [Polychaeton citri CBS 116435]|uniref:Uncharacterized protein n=1 Tax=Polychaeton citri CBS 116435 TaxID=1314669 RepID=A0A9P4Q9A7_9PEZI|nr:hypothetical protein K431DRAFT_345681 [Polychaeton citri CBS 116435]
MSDIGDIGTDKMEAAAAQQQQQQQQQQQVEDTSSSGEADMDLDLSESDLEDEHNDLSLKRSKRIVMMFNPKDESSEKEEKQNEHDPSSLSTPESVVRHKTPPKELNDDEATSAESSSSEGSATAQDDIDHDSIHAMELNQFKKKRDDSPSMSRYLRGKNINDVAFPDGHDAFAQNSSTSAWEIPLSKPDFNELYQRGFPCVCISDIVDSFTYHIYGEEEIMRVAEHVAIVFVTVFLVHERLTKSLGMEGMQIYSMRHEDENVPYPYAEVCSRIIRYRAYPEACDATSTKESVASMQDLTMQTLFALETVRRVNKFLQVEINLKKAAEQSTLARKSLTHEAINNKVKLEWVEWLIPAIVGLLAVGVMLYCYN